MPFDPNGPAVHDGLYGLPHTPEEARVVVLPVPWEATVSYGAGTAQGPAAVLAASRQVDLRDRDTGRPWQAGIALLPIDAEVQAASDAARAQALRVIEAGGAGEDPALRAATEAVNAAGERLNAWVYAETSRLHAAGKLVGVLGGDHSVPLGAIRAAAERHPGLGILHLDAHADLRRAYEGFRFSHASIMYNVLTEVPEVARIVQVGVRDFGEDEEDLIRDHPSRLCTFFDSDLRRQVFDGRPWSQVVGQVVSGLPPRVYLSFDIDGLDPALCPHTGTPVPGGLSFSEVAALMQAVVESGRQIVGFDLVEVAPDPEGRSEWDAAVGARLLYKQIGFALRSQPA